MKIALIGYGKMGRTLDPLAQERGHLIVARLGSDDWGYEALADADLCIDFSQPSAVENNLLKAVRAKKPLILGTTGWYDQEERLRSLAESIPLLYAPNFSIGVNLFFEIAKHAAHLMRSFTQYDAAALELHHREKRDAPSGTGKELVRLVEEQLKRPLPISSVRCGSIVGTHHLLFDSPIDTITLTHEARSREGFAHGALWAAEWLWANKLTQPGWYSFEEMIQDYLQKSVSKPIGVNQ